MDVIEGLLEAPKPHQLVFGNGKKGLGIDAVRCRTNALIKNERPFPVATVLDVIEKPDMRSLGHYGADFYYVDAGPPIDDLLESLPYTGPAWYWCES